MNYPITNMNVEDVAMMLKELGHPVRLTILKILVREGEKGLAVGEIKKRLKIPNSTLSHHLAKLVMIKIIKQRREGRTLYCVIQNNNIHALVSFLDGEYCIK